MTYYGYEINKDYVDSSNNIVWKDSGNGMYIIASRDDKNYFIKRNKNIRKPGKEVESEVLREKMIAECDYVESKQKKLASMMSSIVFEKDHIANELANFWDDGYFVTVTRLVEGGMSDNIDFSVLRKSDKHQILVDMAALVDKLHDLFVIHGDIKRSNFVFARGGEEHRYIPYLIDFDSSYPSFNVPGVDEIVFSPGYETPEIVCYRESEEPNPEIITFKNDVFTLGLEFHNVWTKKMPISKIDKLTVGEALAVSGDKEHQPLLNENLNEYIGDSFRATYLSLINWMLQRDPDDRPDIKEVVMVLDDKLSVPEEFIIGKDDLPFGRLWLCHENCVTFDKKELKELGYVYLKRVVDDGKKYRIKHYDREEEIHTVDELIEKGIFVEKDLVICEPREDDQIEFVSTDILKDKSIYKIERINDGYNEYNVIFNNGMSVNYSVRRLVREGIAARIHKKPTTKYGDPFKEDAGFVYADEDFFKNKNVINISKSNEGEDHYYIVTYSDERGKRMFNSKTMKLLGYLVKEEK